MEEALFLRPKLKKWVFLFLFLSVFCATVSGPAFLPLFMVFVCGWCSGGNVRGGCGVSLQCVDEGVDLVFC